MRRINCTLMVLLMLSLAATHIEAKRGAPKDIAPVTRNGITYSAPQDQMGCVLAKEEKSGTHLWNKQIYVVKYNPDLEKDVQDCFITELRFDGDHLIISNEKGGEFELNVTTLGIKVLKGTELIENGK